MAQHSLSNVSTATVRVLRKLWLLGELETKSLSKEKLKRDDISILRQS